MVKDFFDRCKKNDRGIRFALGDVRRQVILGQFSRFEEQDYYVLAMDRALLSDASNNGFILTVEKDENNIVFVAYYNIVEDMYSIGRFELNRDAETLEQNMKTIASIEQKIEKLANDTPTKLSTLVQILTEEETWFVDYLIEDRWTFENEHSFSKSELKQSIFCYKSIESIIKEFNLTNTNNANV